jgi:hypothetical protein
MHFAPRSSYRKNYQLPTLLIAWQITPAPRWR